MNYSVYILQDEELSPLGTYAERPEKCRHNLIEVSTDIFRVEPKYNIEYIVRYSLKRQC
jgi:hypothetical protein